MNVGTLLIHKMLLKGAVGKRVETESESRKEKKKLKETKIKGPSSFLTLSPPLMVPSTNTGRDDLIGQKLAGSGLKSIVSQPKQAGSTRKSAFHPLIADG